MNDNIIEKINKFLEASTKKINASGIINLLKNTSNWGEMRDYVSVKKGNIEVVDTYFYGGDKAMKALIEKWTSSKGSMAKYFKEEFGITFKLVDKFEMVIARGKYKKLTTDGIVGIIIKIV